MQAAAEALKNAGAVRVTAIALGRTPPAHVSSSVAVQSAWQES